jgi:hypothetical protein
MFGFYIRIGGRPGAWIAGAVFALVGGALLFGAPALAGSSVDAATTMTVMRVLGGTFAVLGLVILAWVAGDSFLANFAPEKQESWNWWGSLLAPMLAAALFSVPSALMLPAFLIAFLLRPDFLFPAGAPIEAGNFLVAALFSGLGLLGLLLMFVIARSALRERHRGRKRHA